MGPSDGVDDVAAVRRALESAENSLDPDAAAVHLADDAVLMVPDFPVQEGKAACVTFLREIMVSLAEHFDRRVTYESAEIAVLGSVAFDRGAFTFTAVAKSDGQQSRTTGKYLWILTRTGGSWRVTRMIVSRDEPTESAGSIGC